MHLASVIHGTVFGGAHNQVLRLRPGLEAAGVRTTVFLPDAPGDAAARLRSAGIQVRSLPLRRLRASDDLAGHIRYAISQPGQIASLSRAFRGECIDLVQIHGITNPDGAVAARRCGLPSVWQLIDTRAPSALRRFMAPVVNAFSSVVMTTGESMIDRFPGIRVPVHPFFPPVDLDRFDSKPTSVSPRIVGSLGNFNPQKGHQDLIEATRLARLAGHYFDLRMHGTVDPGHVSHESALRRQSVDALGADVLRPVPSLGVPDMLKGFGMFVMPSVANSEGIPTVILEAMASGVPCVSTDVGAVRDIIEHGETGLLVAAGNPAAMAKSMIALQSDPDLRLSVIEAATRQLPKFTLEACLKAHLAAYHAAMALGGSCAGIRPPTHRQDGE